MVTGHHLNCKEVVLAMSGLLLPNENIQAERSWLSLRYAYFCLMKIFRLIEVGFRYATPTSA